MEAQIVRVTTSEPGVVALPTRPGTRDPGLRRLDLGHISAAGEEPRRPEVGPFLMSRQTMAGLEPGGEP
jgi:hypothetical protein